MADRWTCGRSRCPSVIWLLLAALLSAADVRLENGAIRVSPVKATSPDWREACPIYVGESDSPVLGSYRVEGDALLFEPRFPFSPGITVRVACQGEAERLKVPERVGHAPARVEKVYPSSGRLPENQLKLYLHFSAPMSRGEAYQHIRLENAAGKPVELPFLELDQELWDASGKRLTLFFDPGRVKREVMPNREVGQALMAGESYTLVIERSWPDAQGQPLAAAHRKAFSVVAADRKSPRPDQWRVEVPRAGSASPLVVRLDEAMDRALLDRELSVSDSGGRAVKGSVEIRSEETEWRFTPDHPWAKGEYSLIAGTALEDLAGNRIDRLFDVDKFDRVERRPARQTRRIRFRIH